MDATPAKGYKGVYSADNGGHTIMWIAYVYRRSPPLLAVLWCDTGPNPCCSHYNPEDMETIEHTVDLPNYR